MGAISGLVNRAKILTDRRYRHVYAQRRITDMPERHAAAVRFAAKLPGALDLLPNDALFESLDRDGYAPVPRLLSPQDVSDIRSFLAAKLTSDPYHPESGRFQSPENAPRGTHVAYFDHQDVISAPHLLAIANNPAILSAVSNVLGAKPTISYMASWWSIAHGEGAKEAELFHRDVDDLRFVKLFVYLTDVDEKSGPHVFVKGSHKVNKLTEIKRRTDGEVAEAFGAENIMRFTGPAGTAFLENTYGVHRGVPPIEKPRLLFQVLYSLTEYIGGPRKPIAKFFREQDGVSIDPYINRVYLR